MSFKSSINLKKGWNLVSFYIKDYNLESILKNKNILEIKSLDKNFNSKLPFKLNTLKEINLGQGYWINTSDETEIILEGTKNITKLEVPLKKGWNLLGYPYNKGQDLIINENINEIKDINKIFNKILPKNLNTLEKFNVGTGYWCNCLKDTSITFSYPFEYIQKDENNEISGLILNDEIDFESLDIFYNKISFYLNFTSKTNIEVPWFSSKHLSYQSMELIKESIFEKRITVYYGEFKGEVQSVGFLIHDKIRVLDKFVGNITIESKPFIDKNKIVTIKFGNSNNLINFNFNKNLISVSTENVNAFINEINFIETTHKLDNLDYSLNSIFLTDYKFENIQVHNLTIMHNENLLKISNVRNSFKNDILNIKVTTENNYFIIEIIKDDNPNKTVLLNFINDKGQSQNSSVQIVKNKLFEITIEDNVYLVSFDWDGQYEETKFTTSKFSTATKYLYWYDFDKIDITSILVNDFNLTDFNYLEKAKDHLILETRHNDLDYKFIIIKDAVYKGCISLTIKYKNINYKYYNSQDSININWTIYNGLSFKIGKNNLTFNWKGNHDPEGFTIRNLDIVKQRLFAKDLNASKIIYLDDFAFKVHYMIGITKDSINLNKWNSYSAFLETLETLLKYMLDYIKLYNLELPKSDYFLRRNGGDANYDIYIKDIPNSNVKGYTTGENLVVHTHNPKDVVTYMVLSNNLDYDWLKTVLFHEFFHSIQGSYDWFDIEWISEGLAVAFEVSLSNNSISSKYFLPNILEKKNLSLSYFKGFKMDSGNTIISRPLSIYGGMRGDCVIELTNLKHYYENVYINGLTMSNIYIKPSNDSSITLKNVIVENYRGEFILRLFLGSSRIYNDLRFLLYVDDKLITSARPAYLSRHYGTFTFFSYLVDRYGETNIFSQILKDGITYDNNFILDETIKKLNSESNFIEEVVNFWCATEILSFTDNVEEKYRMKLASLWKRMYIVDVTRELVVNENFEYMVINDLEPTGCVTLDINFNGHDSAFFEIDKTIDLTLLHLRLVIHLKDNTFKVKKVKPEHNFNITIDNSVYKVKLVIVGDTYYQGNLDIPISIISRESMKKVNKVTSQNIEFEIQVLKKN